MTPLCRDGGQASDAEETEKKAIKVCLLLALKSSFPKSYKSTAQMVQNLSFNISETQRIESGEVLNI